jgi:spermidine synthase
MKLNNSYTLGGSASAVLHRRHSWLPLSIHADPKRVFFLGMGTGISAGASLDHPVETVTVSELSADVIEASRRHFGPVLNGLFEDPRVTVVQEDGRNLLFGRDERYDVIIADLFLSWKAGVGDLYTREHFESVRSRLAPGGLFAQWLPLAQMTEREVGIIVRTMLEVFPEVTAWRRGFSLATPALLLVGREELAPLDNAAFLGNLDRLAQAGKVDRSDWMIRIPHAAYVGNLTLARTRFADARINTDDRPLIEYLAPISHRDAVARSTASLTGNDLVSFSADLLKVSPARSDDYLAALDEG